jgi:hypothetical protein
VALLLLAGLLLGPGVAGAHEGTGQLTVIDGTVVGLEARYEVELVYVDDLHPVLDATVTVVAERPGGPVMAPVVLAGTGQPGRYAGGLTFPAAGSWTVRFTSVTPIAQLERTETLAAPAPSAAPSTEAPTSVTSATGTASGPGATSGSGASAPGTAPDNGVAAPADGAAGGGGSDGPSVGLVVALAAVAVAVVAGAVVLARRGLRAS